MRTDALALAIVVFALVSAFAVSLIVLSSSGNRKQVGVETTLPRFERTTRKSLEETLEKVMSKGGIPGAIIGVWIPGRGAWVEARGVSDVKNGKPMSVNDHVRVASVTKSFVATIVLQLVDAGRVSLDDTLEKYVPSFPGAGSITIRQLLDHSSGVFDFVQDDIFEAACTADPLEKWSPDELLTSSIVHEPYFAPGTGFHYSNTNYVLLGMIVEKVTGEKIGDVIEKRITRPLRLSDTSLPRTPRMPSPGGRGYTERYGGLADVSEVDPSMGWASSGMVSNLRDLHTWAQAFADGSLISQESERERVAATWGEADGTRYGLGIMQWGPFLGHEGNAFGYSTAMFYDPSSNANIIVILNLETRKVTATMAFFEFARVLFPGKVPASAGF